MHHLAPTGKGVLRFPAGTVPGSSVGLTDAAKGNATTGRRHSRGSNSRGYAPDDRHPGDIVAAPLREGGENMVAGPKIGGRDGDLATDRGRTRRDKKRGGVVRLVVLLASVPGTMSHYRLRLSLLLLRY
jgi:hypothetical protein